MVKDEIRERLLSLRDPAYLDPAYRDFQAKIIPTIDPERMLGIKTPVLRKYAKELMKEYANDGIAQELAAFFEDLPHAYFDEDQLHAFLIAEIRDFAVCMAYTEAFLPWIDNWATCDQLSPKVFRKHRGELLEAVRRWIRSDHTYTVRFAMGMLMQHFLDEDYSEEYPELVSSVRSEEYYVNMMIAWYFATALAKQYDAILPYLEERRLDVWTHNKTIQKAVESYRITPEQKDYLRTLRIKGMKRGGSHVPAGA